MNTIIYRDQYVKRVLPFIDKDVIKREFSVLEGIRDNYPKYVLSLDKFDFSWNGIIHKNIRDFLRGNT